MLQLPLESVGLYLMLPAAFSGLGIWLAVVLLERRTVRHRAEPVTYIRCWLRDWRTNHGLASEPSLAAVGHAPMDRADV